MSIAADAEVGTVARPGLRGQVAFIANASEPVGAAIAQRLASNGATVGLCGNDRQELTLVAAEIAANGGKAVIAMPEGSEVTEVPDIEDSIRQGLGRIDIFINSLPEISGRSLDELCVGDVADNIGTILKNSLAYLQTTIAIMRKQKYGRVVNVFTLAYLGLPGQVAAAAAYAGAFGLTRSAALETARDGITVNSVVKGDIIAPNRPIDDVAKIVAAIPVRRIGAVDDVIHAIRYLVSPATAYVTGQTLFVCGGRSVYFSLSV